MQFNHRRAWCLSKGARRVHLVFVHKGTSKNSSCRCLCEFAEARMGQLGFFDADKRLAARAWKAQSNPHNE